MQNKNGRLFFKGQAFPFRVSSILALRCQERLESAFSKITTSWTLHPLSCRWKRGKLSSDQEGKAESILSPWLKSISSFAEGTDLAHFFL